jgi:hypothetical protein
MRKLLAPLILACALVVNHASVASVAAGADLGVASDGQASTRSVVTYYPDGRVVVAVDAAVMSQDQCPSGRFCTWLYSGYLGSVTYWSGSGVSRSISGTVGSFWNNRTGAARLYSASGASSTCYGAGAKSSSVSSSYSNASSVYLYASASC